MPDGWFIYTFYTHIAVSGNQIFLRIRSITSCERSDAFKFPLITVVDIPLQKVYEDGFNLGWMEVASDRDLSILIYIPFRNRLI